MIPVSVAIITRNRQTELAHCLSSLACQSFPPYEVIVVDNASDDDTRAIVLNFKKNVAFPVYYHIEPNIGYPFARNKAIKRAHYDWIAFIDDDCVADINWCKTIQSILVKHRKKKNIAAILGHSLNYYPNNPFASALQYSHELWKKQTIHGSIKNYEVLDTRNILYHRPALHKYGVTFNNEYTKGSEDSDIGLQIKNAGLLAIHAPSIYVYHKESQTIAEYVSKKRKYLQSTNYFHKIRNYTPIYLYVSPKTKLSLWHLCTIKLNWIQTLIALCIVYSRIYAWWPIQYEK